MPLLKISYQNLEIYYKMGNLECYPPKEDSFLLAKWVEKSSKGIVLDMGTGSGIQGLVAYSTGNVQKLYLSDIDRESLKIAAINFYTNFIKKEDPEKLLRKIDEVMKRLESINVYITNSNLFEKIPRLKFDLIIFNPPYLPLEGNEDAKTKRWVVGGEEGNEIIIKFLDEASKFLKTNGKILFVFSSLTNPKRIFNKFKEKYRFEKLDEERFFFEKIYVYKAWRKENIL